MQLSSMLTFVNTHVLRKQLSIKTGATKYIRNKFLAATFLQHTFWVEMRGK